MKNIVAEKSIFKAGEFFYIYAGCLYLSIKMVIDSEIWFLTAFYLASGILTSSIEKMELFIFEDILIFKV